MQSGPDGSSFIYNSVNNVLERHPVMADVPTPPSFIGQIPRNFCLSHLTADFSISSDILDNYSRSPYLAADTDFLNPHGNEDIQQEWIMDID
ncbi:hypothetical protein L1887_06151 [Cichorium endivia]|nr:hypothetical protein L1887_06151 [Cichorium endivia]